jgi:transposase
LRDAAACRFSNDKAGYKALIIWVGHDAARVVFEPSGAYHCAFERALAKASLPLIKVNPRQARRFAEAIGKLAKTDHLDAALLARMGTLLSLSPHSPDEAIICGAMTVIQL